MSKAHKVFTTPKPAYIDGGLAAILIQGAMGAVLAALLYIKIYWHKLKSFFSKAPASDAPKDGGADS